MDTQDPNLPLRAEALLSHTDWVRALVRGLGIRESEADDVVQSTWVAALASPPRAESEGPGMRAWVARVARNFALKRLGGDQRRASREREGARAERLPSTADVVEREEARARIVSAVLDVDEPYRTTLLLRFYEGLEPRDIARRQNVPASTVRNRLKRGLASLRERLEASEGANWRQRCLLVLPAIRGAPQGPGWLPKWAGVSATSGGAVAIKVFGVAAAVALVAGGWTIVSSRAASKRDLLSVGASVAGTEWTGSFAASTPREVSGEPAGELTALDASSSVAARESAKASDSSAGAVDDGLRCVLRGTLRSPDGKPLEPMEFPFVGVGAHVEVGVGVDAPAGGLAKRRAELEMVAVEGMKVAEGDQYFRVPEPIPFAGTSGAVTPTVSDERKFTIERAASDLAASKGVLREQSKIALSSEIFEDISVGVERGVALGQRGHVLIASAKGDARELEVDDKGNFEFGGLMPDRWRLFATAPGFSAFRMDFEIGRGEREKQLDVTFLPLQALRVKMVTPEGRDLLDAVVSDAGLGQAFLPIPFAMRETPRSRITDLGEDSGRLYAAASWRHRSEVDDKAALDASGVLLLHESLPLHVGISVRGVVLEERLVPSGAEEVVFIVSLDRIRGVVSTASIRLVSAQDGLPIANATVVMPDGGATSTDDRGFAELDGLPPGWRKIDIDAEGFEHRAEWVELEPGAKNDLGVRELGSATVIAGRLVDENGNPVVAGVEIRALDGGTSDPQGSQSRALLAGRELPIVDAVETDSEGRFRFERSGSRRYLLLVYGEDWAAPPTTVESRAGETADLVIEARRCGELKLTFPVEPRPDSFYVVESAGIHVAVHPCDGWRPLAVRLGIGDYRVRLADGARSLWVRRVIIQPDQMMAFDETHPGAKPSQD